MLDPTWLRKQKSTSRREIVGAAALVVHVWFRRSRSQRTSALVAGTLQIAVRTLVVAVKKKKLTSAKSARESLVRPLSSCSSTELMSA